MTVNLHMGFFAAKVAALRMGSRNMGSRRLGGSAPTGCRNISSVPSERCSTVADTDTPSDNSPQMSEICYGIFMPIDAI